MSLVGAVAHLVFIGGRFDGYVIETIEPMPPAVFNIGIPKSDGGRIQYTYFYDRSDDNPDRGITRHLYRNTRTK